MTVEASMPKVMAALPLPERCRREIRTNPYSFMLRMMQTTAPHHSLP